ncbi:hypothetical protein JOD29_001044 [Lysinibacillus composti]|nr:hypothetical protein [Lysinibacillus composti]
MVKGDTLDFFGNVTEIDLIIDGEEDGQFGEGQNAAYQSLIQNWNDLQQNLVDSILTYYIQKRQELGY